MLTKMTKYGSEFKIRASRLVYFTSSSHSVIIKVLCITLIYKMRIVFVTVLLQWEGHL